MGLSLSVECKAVKPCEAFRSAKNIICLVQYMERDAPAMGLVLPHYGGAYLLAECFLLRMTNSSAINNSNRVKAMLKKIKYKPQTKAIPPELL